MAPELDAFEEQAAIVFRAMLTASLSGLVAAGTPVDDARAVSRAALFMLNHAAGALWNPPDAKREAAISNKVESHWPTLKQWLDAELAESLELAE